MKCVDSSTMLDTILPKCIALRDIFFTLTLTCWLPKHDNLKGLTWSHYLQEKIKREKRKMVNKKVNPINSDCPFSSNTDIIGKPQKRSFQISEIRIKIYMTADLFWYLRSLTLK